MSLLIGSLNLKNFIDLIDACGKNGVTKLKLGDFEVEFSGSQTIVQPEHMVTPISSSEFDFDKEIEDNEDKVEEVDLEELKLSDPIEYERYISGEETL